MTQINHDVKMTSQPNLLLALGVLNRRLVLADSIGQAVHDATCSGEPPAWVHVYRDQLEGIRDAAEVLECLIHKGYGAMPHESEAKQARLRSKGATSRVIGSPAHPMPSRPDKRSPGLQTRNSVTGTVDIVSPSVDNLVQQ